MRPSDDPQHARRNNISRVYSEPHSTRLIVERFENPPYCGFCGIYIEPILSQYKFVASRESEMCFFKGTGNGTELCHFAPCHITCAFSPCRFSVPCHPVSFLPMSFLWAFSPGLFSRSLFCPVSFLLCAFSPLCLCLLCLISAPILCTFLCLLPSCTSNQ